MSQYFKNPDPKIFGIKKLNLENEEVEELNLEDVFSSLSYIMGLEIKTVMDNLGFHSEIDEYVNEMVHLVNQIEHLKTNFDCSLEILRSKFDEEIPLIINKYSLVKQNFVKCHKKEDFAVVPMKYYVYTFHDRYLIDLRYIVKNAFALNKDREISLKRDEEILHRTRILNEYLRMGLEHYPLVAFFAKDDIFRHPKNSDVWQDIYEVVNVKQILSKAEIDANFSMLYYIVRIAGIVLKKHVEIRDKEGTNKILTLVKEFAYYATQHSKAEIRSHVCQIKPQLHEAFQVWNLPEHPILTKCATIMTPIIGYDKIVYLPKLFPAITKEVILKEYADNTFNKLMPDRELQKGAPDLSGARDEVIEEILYKGENKVQVRILAPENLGIDPEAKHYIRGVANTVRKFWEAPLNLGSGKAKEDINRAIIIHIHGGGFVSSSSASHRAYLNKWVKDLNLVHFSIDYRLAPQNQYPDGLDDCWQAYLWILNYAETILGVKAEKIILIGDSAGGNLCAALTLRLIRAGIRAPDGMLLLYPCLYVDADSHSPSYFTSIKNPLLPTAVLKLIAYAYVPEGFKNTEDPFISPMLASDELLEKFPPVRIVAGSDDPLFDDNFRLISKLKRLNRNVSMIVHKDIPHAFFSHPSLKKHDEFLGESLGLIKELLSLKY